MLLDVLRAIAAAEVRSQQELAGTLGVSLDMIAQITAHLEQLGYLEPSTLCVEACSHCSSAVACGESRALRLWTVTEKGRRALGAHANLDHG